MTASCEATQSIRSTRKLYLNLAEPEDQQYDNQKIYKFEFLTAYDPRTSSNAWFEVRRILDFDEQKCLSQINRELASRGLIGNPYAEETLLRLFDAIHREKLINYYLQDDQDPDKVLEIFIRTNSGGTPLSFSDLLMSIASANWKKIDARQEFERLISEVRGIGRADFKISKDFILKTCLVLFIDNIKFQLKNFTFQNVNVFEDNWDKVRESISAAFTLFDQMDFNDTTFRAKNAAIPVIFYIYNKGTAGSIIRQNYSSEPERKTISQWLNLTFLKSIFSGQTDSVLANMRRVLRESTSDSFPAQELINAFRNDPARNYSFDDDVVDGLLKAQKGSNEAFYVLHLIYSGLDFMNSNFHQDHLHPASIFTDEKKLEANIPQADLDFARDPANWNSVANLQLLGGNFNCSKNDSMLEDWANEHNISKHELLVSDDTSLKIGDFRAFIENRRENMKKRLREITASS